VTVFDVVTNDRPTVIQADISRSRPTIPCRCGTQLTGLHGRRIREAGSRLPAYSYLFTCPVCQAGYVVRSALTLQVATPPTGSSRNEPCPCGSGRKAKKCHPDGTA